MTDDSELQIDRLLEEYRDQAVERRENLASIVDAVAELRDSCETLRLMLAVMESSVAVDLKLVDALTSARRVGTAWKEPSEHEREGGC